ncbi:MAG: polyprenyl synthetase family protein [Flavobacteriaceae bacterium]|nr:polyprenyl synthetase family protein [Flavobacteriaceae bacterium]
MKVIEAYQKEFLKSLKGFELDKAPQSLYEPVNYILSLGGKRLRPVLTLMTCDIFNSDYKDAINAALAVEVFHNFSLIHDDIMDEAPLRRGQETVHKKWNLNTGILSGDAMLILAYQLFEHYDPEVFQSLAKLFSKTALEVCEGQQYDMDFETRDDVTIAEYLQMIEYKTAVLVGAAMKMGAIIANASISDQHGVYEFGKNLGIAFQLQDDYLDAFGDPETFGKQIGGDIIENKKTYLYLKALELADGAQKEELTHLYSLTSNESSVKIDGVKSIFESSGSSEASKAAIELYTSKAFAVLETLSISKANKVALRNFGTALMTRKV